MKADRIIDALGKVKEDYIMESAPGKKKTNKPHIRWIAAVIALVMILTFFQTAPGVAALEIVKEAITSFIETFFPPKDIPVNVEGETEVQHQEAGGQEPEIQEDGSVSVPGFAIYYDTETYTMSEEDGVTYIRFVTDNDLPPCEMEIRHIPNMAPADAAASTNKEMAESWDSVSEVRNLDAQDGYAFYFGAGTSWDSACGYVYFLSDGRNGCFQITARYFVEATEGHGSRFAQMVQTFEVIDPVANDYSVASDPSNMAKTATFGEWGAVKAKFERILSGEECFWDPDQAESMTIDQYCQSFSAISEVEATITKYALADLDADNLPELILWITVNGNNDYGFLVIRYDGSGGAIGHSFTYRQMMNLKSDGTFGYSGGASNNGTAKLKFTDSGWEYVILGGVEDNNEKVSFFWNGQSVSQDEYWSYVEVQDAKESAEWVTYPSDKYTLSFPGLE